PQAPPAGRYDAMQQTLMNQSASYLALWHKADGHKAHGARGQPAATTTATAARPPVGALHAPVAPPPGGGGGDEGASRVPRVSVVR
ncbi:MAG: hypothetical protein ABIT83_05550, partial [Massilia sp.]